MRHASLYLQDSPKKGGCLFISATQATFLISTKILSIHDNSRQTHDNRELTSRQLTTRSRHLTTFPTTRSRHLTTNSRQTHDISRQVLKCPDSSRHSHDKLTTNSRQCLSCLSTIIAILYEFTAPFFIVPP